LRRTGTHTDQREPIELPCASIRRTSSDCRCAGSAQGGDDRLISGINATDQMSGDAALLLDSATGGNDTFMFVDAFGQDFVNDFRQGEDTLEFQVASVSDFDDLVIVLNGSDTVISTTASATDTVTVVGFTATLTESDVLFS
jgi:hypothetical protein